MTSVRSACAFTFRHIPMFKGKGRLVLFVDHFLTRSDQASSFLAVGTVNDLARMNLDLRPWGQKFAYYYGDWEKDFIDLTRRLYTDGAFVDIGSSLGLYVVCVGDLVRKAGGVILSVEPVAFNLEKQRNNVRLNELGDVVQYFQVAVGASEGTLRVRADPDERDNNAFVSSDGDIDVRVITLDRLVTESGAGRVGFIKMDVEGYEPMVMIGAQATIRENHPVIFAEFNRERMAINKFDMMPSWQLLMGEGYRAFRVLKGKLHPLPDPGDVENIFFLPDHVPLPPDIVA